MAFALVVKLLFLRLFELLLSEFSHGLVLNMDGPLLGIPLDSCLDVSWLIPSCSLACSQTLLTSWAADWLERAVLEEAYLSFSNWILLFSFLFPLWTRSFRCFVIGLCLFGSAGSDFFGFEYFKRPWRLKSSWRSGSIIGDRALFGSFRNHRVPAHKSEVLRTSQRRFIHGFALSDIPWSCSKVGRQVHISLNCVQRSVSLNLFSVSSYVLLSLILFLLEVRDFLVLLSESHFFFFLSLPQNLFSSFQNRMGSFIEEKAWRIPIRTTAVALNVTKLRRGFVNGLVSFLLSVL